MWEDVSLPMPQSDQPSDIECIELCSWKTIHQLCGRPSVVSKEMQPHNLSESSSRSSNEHQNCISLSIVVRPETLGFDYLQDFDNVHVETRFPSRHTDGRVCVRCSVIGAHRRAAERARFASLTLEYYRCNSQQVALTG